MFSPTELAVSPGGDDSRVEMNLYVEYSRVEMNEAYDASALLISSEGRLLRSTPPTENHSKAIARRRPHLPTM